MRKLLSVLVSILGLGTAAAVVAQTVEGLDIRAIEARGAVHAEEVEAMLGQALERARTYDEEAQAIADAARADLRRARAVPGGGGANGVDLDELVEGARASLTEPNGAPLFLVFASLSMPEEALKPLIADVRDAGGVVVFRGLPQNNGRAMVSAFTRIMDHETAVNVAIDPRLFRAFRVDVAPTFVAAGSDFAPCDDLDCTSPPPPHDRMSGNVTVRYALERFADAGGPGAPVARIALANLARP